MAFSCFNLINTIITLTLFEAFLDGRGLKRSVLGLEQTHCILLDHLDLQFLRAEASYCVK